MQINSINCQNYNVFTGQNRHNALKSHFRHLIKNKEAQTIDFTGFLPLFIFFECCMEFLL